MTYTIEIPDDQLQELAQAVATARGWTPTIIQPNAETGEPETVPNSITANQVLTDATRKFWQDEVRAYRARLAAATVEEPELSLTVQ